MLLGVAAAEARRRRTPSSLGGVELDDLVEQAADDALIAILAKLETFRGDSRFTTWAYSFAIYEVSTKITRHAWRRTPPRPESDIADRLPDAFGFGPVERVEWRELLTALADAIEVELTEHQRRVFVEIVLRETPLDVLADELRTNRNALYKALFDARRKLRAALVAHGHMDGDEKSP